MKTLRVILLACSLAIILPSCKVWNNLFGPKYDCPSNGKNVGAEKLLGGDPKAEKSARKAKKFKS